MKTADQYIAEASAVSSEPAAEASPAVTAGAETPAPAPASSESAFAQASAPAAKAEAKAEPEAKPADRVTRTYEDVARAKAEVRAEKAALAAEREKMSNARALVEAAERGDAMALLAGAKIPWSKAARQVLEGHGKLDPEPEAKAQPDERDRRLAELENKLRQSEMATQKRELMSRLTAHVSATPEKFKHVSHLKVEAEAIGFLEDYYNRTGEMPGQDFTETMDIALEAVEAHHASIAKRYGSLTPAPSVTTVPGSKAAVPAAGAVSQQAAKTLTNGDGSGPTPTNAQPRQPKTDEDYIRAALEIASAQ